MKLFLKHGLAVFLLLLYAVQVNANIAIYSNDEYKTIFSLLGAQNNHDKARHLENIAEHLTKNRHHPVSLLEIGPGDGQLASHYLPYFDKITLFEPNLEYCHAYQNKANITLFKQGYDPFLLGNNQYDAIFAISVFYHLPMNQWHKVLNSFYHHLNQKGQEVIVLAKPSDDYLQLYQSIQKNLSKKYPLQFPASTTIKSLLNQYDQLKVEEIILDKSKICTKNNQSIFLTLKFIVYSNFLSQETLDNLSQKDISLIDSIIRSYQTSRTAAQQKCFKWTDVLLIARKTNERSFNKANTVRVVRP